MSYVWLDDGSPGRVEIEAGNVLVDHSSGRKLVLNATGVAYFDVLRRHGPGPEAAREVSARFGLSVEHAHSELNEFAALVDRGQSCTGSILPGTRHAVLEPTSGCNGGCPHCYHGSHSDGWDADQVAGALDSLNSAGIRSVSVTGGEVLSPHYVEQFFSLLPELERRGVLVASVSTNATFITEQLVDRLCTAVPGGTVFRISLDALRGTVLDRVRPGYRRLDDPYFPIGRLDEAGFDLVFTTNLSAQTPADVVEIGNYLRRYQRIKAWNVRMAVPVHYGTGVRVRAKGRLRHLLSGRPDPALSIAFYEALLREHAQDPYPFDVRMGNYLMTSLLRNPHALSALDDPHPCREDKDLVTFKATGEITQCPILNELDAELTMGNALDPTGLDLDEDYTAGLPLAGLDIGEMACASCHLRPACGGGCRLYALAYDQGIDGCDLPAYALLTWILEDPSHILRSHWPEYHARVLEIVDQPQTAGNRP